MNYSHLLLVASIAACGGFKLTTASHRDGQPVPLPGLTQPLQKIPQEKFRVVIQKGGTDAASKDFEFFYMFCKFNSPTEMIYSDILVREKKMASKTTAPKTFRNGFSKLVDKNNMQTLFSGSNTGGSITEAAYIRLFVSKNWRALDAKRNNLATDEQNKTIFVSDPVTRYRPNDIDKASLCTTLRAGFVASVVGKITFTVSQDASTSSGLNVTIKDDRACQQSKISNTARAQAATGSAYSRAKEKASGLAKAAKDKAGSAWQSTKSAASSAKDKVSNAASRAKASVARRFGK